VPRSVVHEIEGGELRVWRTSDEWFHLKTTLIRDHNGTAYEVESRWDIPPGATTWSEVADRARDGDRSAADQLADTMFDEAVEGA